MVSGSGSTCEKPAIRPRWVHNHIGIWQQVQILNGCALAINEDAAGILVALDGLVQEKLRAGFYVQKHDWEFAERLLKFCDFVELAREVMIGNGNDHYISAQAGPVETGGTGTFYFVPNERMRTVTSLLPDRNARQRT